MYWAGPTGKWASNNFITYMLKIMQKINFASNLRPLIID